MQESEREQAEALGLAPEWEQAQVEEWELAQDLERARAEEEKGLEKARANRRTKRFMRFCMR